MQTVMESYQLLASDNDIILVEGAGSAAEVNLRGNDIANMGFARAAKCPVILVGDIDRGGVIASLVGTHTVLCDEDRAMIRGFLINKFRGDASLFASGAAEIETRTGWKNLGLIPYNHGLSLLPQEDSMAIKKQPSTQQPSSVHIVILTTPQIANFDDLDPLKNEPGVKLTWLNAGQALPADATLVILAGSKSTISDLEFIRAQGWDIDLKAHYRRGGHVLGICGGYQMLGRALSDPNGLDGAPASVEGLRLLDITTQFSSEKTVTPWSGSYNGMNVAGYEIHTGISDGEDRKRPVFSGNEGARSSDDRVWGTYVHGLFANDQFRKSYLSRLGLKPSNYAYNAHMQQILDEWADILESAVSIETMLALAAPVQA